MKTPNVGKVKGESEYVRIECHLLARYSTPARGHQDEFNRKLFHHNGGKEGGDDDTYSIDYRIFIQSIVKEL